MTEPTVISVRGEAREQVPPDAVELQGTVRATDGDKAAAMTRASAAVRALTDDLATLGGVARTVETARAPLTWLARSAGAGPEWHPTKGHETGRTTASAWVTITVRDMTLLDRVANRLSTHEALDQHGVEWLVDADNPGWRAARSAAIADALVKGRDYAEALGGRLVGIEHLADAGLLGGEPSPMMFSRAVPLAASGGTPLGAAPSLDPVPQELSAVIEARFRAEVPGLA